MSDRGAGGARRRRHPFATKDSLTAGTLAGVCPAPYSEDPAIDAKVWEMLHVAHVFERAGEFDLIHNQADFVPLAFSRLVATPVVTTIHGFSSDRILPAFKAYEDRVHYVAISDADRHPDLRYAATIHHGIRLEDFPFDPHGSDDLLFFGRIHPDKGADEAIEAARRAGRRLVMAGIVQDQDYYDGQVAPALHERSVVYRGPVGGARPHDSAGLRARAAPPHQFRRAVWTVSCGGARLWHPGHRLQPRIDARTDRPWRDRLSGRTASMRPWLRSAASVTSIALPAGRLCRRALRSSVWPIDIWNSYRSFDRLKRFAVHFPARLRRARSPVLLTSTCRIFCQTFLPTAVKVGIAQKDPAIRPTHLTSSLNRSFVDVRRTRVVLAGPAAALG